MKICFITIVPHTGSLNPLKTIAKHQENKGDEITFVVPEELKTNIPKQYKTISLGRVNYNKPFSEKLKGGIYDQIGIYSSGIMKYIFDIYWEASKSMTRVCDEINDDIPDIFIMDD